MLTANVDAKKGRPALVLPVGEGQAPTEEEIFRAVSGFKASGLRMPRNISNKNNNGTLLV